MKSIVILSVFLLVGIFMCLKGFADVHFNHLIVKAKVAEVAEFTTFSAGSGSASIEMANGKVTLTNCTREQAATAFMDIFESNFKTEEIAPGVKRTHVTIGAIRVGVYSGAVRWPGIKNMDSESKGYWDAVVCVFKTRYPNGR